MENTGKVRPVLIIINSLDDTELILSGLGGIKEIQFVVVRTRAEFELVYTIDKFQAIIANHILPDGNGSDILEKVKRLEFHLPVIIISEASGEEIVFEMIKRGASDCISKNNLSKLPFAFLSALKAAEFLHETMTKKMADKERLIMELTRNNNNLMQFTYIVSHNLRVPIANLLGLSELLKTEITEQERKSVNEYIIKSIETIDEFVKDLNNVLSAKDALQHKKESCNFKNIIDVVVLDLYKEIESSQAEISVNINKEAEEVLSIKSYVQSAFYNLISNALKYRSPERKPDIKIDIKKVDGKTNITITDNGTGIDVEKHKEQLFGLYSRFNNTTDGKGLGLYMTKAQIEALGGTISILSEINVGTTFVITL